jgi:hypothetical protein
MAKQQSVGTARAPEGFRRVGSVSDAGWFDQSLVGNVCHGKLEGLYERKDAIAKGGTSKFFQVQITEDCQVRMGHAEDAKIVTAKAGDHVNLNHGPKTRPLEKIIAQIEQGAEYKVWVGVIGQKIKLTGGRTMHNLDVQVQQDRPPRAIEEETPDFSDGSDEANS